ncbi:aminodeoxychorismate lyase [Embleya sp. NPDC005575]|uniref:aminodeoxychorismate lyase n=1 Tax=Embleya sp. NPDC005575 TaxID=3156892 RepID=UPI0033B6C067
MSDSPASGAPVPGTLVHLDGTVADRARPALRADDLGVLRGDGVFEALLIVDGRPRYLDEHLARLARSAAALRMPPPDAEAWRRCLAVAIDRHGVVGESYARLVLTRGPEGGGPGTGYVLVDPIPASTRRARAEGVRTVTVTRGVVATPADRVPWLLSGAKTLSYAVNMAAQRWARAHGADDAIILAEDGTVLEAPTAAVVVASAHTLRTPPLDLGILASIAQRRLFDAAAGAGWKCGHARLSVADLRAADGVWLVSSVRLAVRVTAIDAVPCPQSPRHDEIVDLLRAD